jgi:hypothetical protein
MRLKSVAQEDAFGCGIACVAFVCGISYEDAKALFQKHEGTKPDCYCPDVVAALSKAGRRYSWRRIVRRPRYKDGSIIFVAKSRRLPAGHYLVRWKGRWMDPWKNLDISDPRIRKARAGFRKRLPGKASYYVFQSNQGGRHKHASQGKPYPREG